MASNGTPLTSGHAAAMIAAWLVCCAAGGGALLLYDLRPAEQAESRSDWPDTDALARSRHQHTLVVAAHPKCPCTRATLAELSRLMTRLRGRVHTHVLFVKPVGAPDGFERTDLWRAADRIHDVTPHVDAEGRVATLFGAHTSGTVALYDRAGRLIFRGGLTPSRGHEGDSVGKRRIVELVESGATDRNASAVFGCKLAEDAS